MKDFKPKKIEAQSRTRPGIQYFLMARENGDIVANWFTGFGGSWFHGQPKEFVAWAEVKKPSVER